MQIEESQLLSKEIEFKSVIKGATLVILLIESTAFASLAATQQLYEHLVVLERQCYKLCSLMDINMERKYCSGNY